ncbi:MAG: FUN14 domain-containing protein [Candidatus Bathyarchaeia archaeon]|jgi:uncharacterized membrane protein (Fun14 family)
MSQSIPSWSSSLLVDLGTGGIVGFAVGYALKKILKLLLLVAGTVLLILTATIEYLQGKGIVTIQVNHDVLNAWISSASAWGMNQLTVVTGWVFQLGAGLTGLTGGFAIGFYKG